MCVCRLFHVSKLIATRLGVIEFPFIWLSRTPTAIKYFFTFRHPVLPPQSYACVTNTALLTDHSALSICDIPILYHRVGLYRGTNKLAHAHSPLFLVSWRRLTDQIYFFITRKTKHTSSLK